MSVKVILSLCLVALAFGRPDDAPASEGYGYDAPEHPLSYNQEKHENSRPGRGPMSFAAKGKGKRVKKKLGNYDKDHPHVSNKNYVENGALVPKDGMPFDFSYEVKDDYKDLDHGHSSNSDGKVVTGRYYVLLPDGRTQIVEYTADHYNGYQAEVTYEGEAKYPEPKPYEPAPSYGAPKNTYKAPEPTYEEPSPTYGTPSPTYEEPKSLYGAPDH